MQCKKFKTCELEPFGAAGERDSASRLPLVAQNESRGAQTRVWSTCASHTCMQRRRRLWRRRLWRCVGAPSSDPSASCMLSATSRAIASGSGSIVEGLRWPRKKARGPCKRVARFARFACARCVVMIWTGSYDSPPDPVVRRQIRRGQTSAQLTTGHTARATG